jgi:hypothetical protein
LIEWGEVHPTESLPGRAVGLESLVLGGVAIELAVWLGVTVAAGAPPLVAELAAPLGRVRLAAPKPSCA